MTKKIIFVFAVFLASCTSNKALKHPLDKSKSKTVVLENGLKVYLLSDPSFNVSAASVSVEVGSLDNPDDRQGLAHFLEHMLFLGTEKYPDVDEYSSYLKTYGGYSNAYTASDHTNYQFQVLPDGFEGALDRFSQFFISPLFTEEYTAREVNAVNSEHQKNKLNDNWRQFRVSSLFAKEGHPERKFGTGNLETLGDITREELIRFYKQHYSANRMGVALLSTHTLEEMESWCRQYFSSIKNHNLDRNKYDPNFLEKKETFRLIQIDPVKDVRNLNLLFSLPATRHLYKSKPGRQFGFILGYEGKGSLLSYLKQKGWALSLSAGAGSETSDYGNASVRIGLTEEGQKNYKDVIKATMDYIELMRSEGHQKHVFDELKSMASLNEIYASKGEGMWRATQLANEAMMYPLEDVGRVNYLYSDFSSDRYNLILDHIRPNNMLAMLIAKGVETNKKEHFYEAPYSYTEDDAFYKELIVTQTYEDFLIPEPNPFIPKEASVPNRAFKEDVYPEVLKDKKGVKLYFGQDHEFLRPKGVIGLKIMFPKEKMNLTHRVHSKIYAKCVNESLNEISYPAKQAGLNFSVKEGYEGIYLDVNGYKESAMVLYELILKHMVDFSISESQFSAIKDKTVRDYKNFALSDAYQQTREVGMELFMNVKYSWEESLPVADAASLADIKSFGESLYANTFLEAMVYGDFEKSDAKKVISLFQEKTNTVGIEKNEAFNVEYLKLRQPETIQYTNKLLVNNSCFYREYLIGKDSPDLRAKTKVIGTALQQPFFTEMRTNQQLGYIVGSYPNNKDKNYYLSFLIQSGEYSADDVNQRAEKFISTTQQIFDEMQDETFNQLIKSEIEKLEKSPMSISERAMKLKNIIFENDADYLRDQKTIDALNNLQKKSVVSLLNQTVSPKTRRMVNVLSFAENHENTTGAKTSFDDLAKWKNSRVYE